MYSTASLLSIDTPLGLMVAASSGKVLLGLEFANNRPRVAATPCPILSSIEEELSLYFAGKLKTFKTAIALNGTPFQKKVWAALQQIPYGTTVSYADLAEAVSHPKAARAVGSANRKNRFAILIPCHRVIGSNGDLSGYASGVWRKKWLLHHETLTQGPSPVITREA